MPQPPQRYTVRRGDTLGRIAARFDVSVGALVDANAATYPSLRTNPGFVRIGWGLEIPTEGGPNDRILFVGMNPGAVVEHRALASTGVDVVPVLDSPEGDDRLRVAGVVHDLSTEEGALGFARTLSMSPDQTAAIARVLIDAPPDARDELGRMAEVWAEAEKGRSIPARLVLSGHSVGAGVWGDENGTLTLDAIGELATAMPRAARAIEDVHVSGCYSGGRYALLRLQAIFPHVATIWAYAGSAPGAESGATTHEALWERATRGRAETIDRSIAEDTRKGENVVVWSRVTGLDDGNSARPLESLRIDLAYFEPLQALYDSGDLVVDDPQSGQLRDYYDALHALLAHPDVPADERAALSARRDHTVRLLYYRRTVAPRFAAHHAEVIRDGYRSLGLPAVDYSVLSRRDALAQIEAFSSRARAAGAPEAAVVLANLLERGLRDLDPAVIPDGWV
ncbi:LysM peptidoglycan-binding domain-containing protein [Polyangium jinanense]|uniref:LysM peptidoglycan-binding domain-containing protein n=1 Tax=Polyangium jinanense TaxID=2829994 RepID=A0A9X3X8D3_9BACT|nr:LysM domain-containing protein [Polyangium jinanense]MDC3958314.1 LysM peptidoglycan-binding domain-containing protein [Polyangium jinanense]MDC3983351.1 LysM peptidoglycan-binding domain-containing protein [Polyangium jinanense]